MSLNVVGNASTDIILVISSNIKRVMKFASYFAKL